MSEPTLRRVLSARDLILYGIVLITPIAPVPIYGVAQELSRGHLILTLVLAGVAMMLTAFSYGRMATIHPSAGSAYAYVGHGLNPSLGFIAGWTMTLDYIVLPICRDHSSLPGYSPIGTIDLLSDLGHVVYRTHHHPELAGHQNHCSNKYSRLAHHGDHHHSILRLRHPISLRGSWRQRSALSSATL